MEYVASNYNLSTYQANISIAAGTYQENINLPKYNATTGSIYIRSASDEEDSVIIKGSVFANRSVGRFTLRSLTIANTSGEPSHGSAINFFAVSCYSGASVTLMHCKMSLGELGPSGQKFALYVSSGEVVIQGLTQGEYALKVTDKVGDSAGDPLDKVLVSLNSGVISFSGDITVDCSSFTVCAHAYRLGLIEQTTRNGWASPVVSGTCSGKRYEVATNGIIETHGGGAEYFPGDTAGSTDTGGQYV